MLCQCLKETGPCPVLLKAVTARLETEGPLAKYATLGFDAMSLSEALRYHEHLDKIVGYEDVGTAGRTNKVANQGLVAVLRGIQGSWKLPIAYYLIRDNPSQARFDVIIKECVVAAEAAGVIVKVLTCDQEKTQWAALCKAGVSPDNPLIPHPVTSQPIFVIPDPPHSLKNTRNALMKNDILFAPRQFARWEDFQRLYLFRKQRNIAIFSQTDTFAY